MTAEDFYDKYEDQVSDIDDPTGIQEIKINPQYYLHDCILKLNMALAMPDKTNFHDHYVFLVGHLESLCYASGYIPDDYENKINDKLEKYKAEGYSLESRKVLISQEKMRLLLQKVFGAKATGFIGKM